MESDAKILVVDDDSIAVFIVTKSLEKLGWKNLTAASNVAEAKQVFELFHPDAAIIDLNLGKESGFELAKSLRERKPELGIIYLSASIDPLQINEALSIEGSLYHDRSLPFEELALAIGKL